MPSLKTQSLLENSNVVITVGNRPNTARSVLKKLAATTLVLAASMGAAQAQSFDPVSQYGDNELTRAAASQSAPARYETQTVRPSFEQRFQVREQSREQTPVLVGRVTAVERIRPGRTAKQNLGTVAGGIVGGLLGNQFGGGDGKKVMTAVGAIAGGSMGNRIAKRNEARGSQVGNFQNARQVEDNVVIRVSVNNGPDYRTYEIVQPSGIPLRRGDDVYLTTANDGRSLVALPINPENDRSYRRSSRRP